MNVKSLESPSFVLYAINQWCNQDFLQDQDQDQDLNFKIKTKIL